MSRIVVIGGVNMDLHMFGVRRPSTTTTLQVDHYLTQPGGKGANVARAAARLGADVRLVARIGDDEFGQACLAATEADGVDTSAVVVSPNAPTGFVAIELAEGRHRSLLFAPGANDDLSWDDIEPAVADLGPADIVVVQAEIPIEALATLAAWTTARSVTLFLDPTPPERVRHDVLRTADVITPDRAEAAALTGRADSSELWPELAARDLLAAGARIVLVKTGETGAVLADAHGIVRVPTLAVDAVDETGAGDVFLAGLAVRRSEGADWLEAVRFANAASALSVANSGLLLPTRDDVAEGVGRIVDPPGARTAG
jgi:ribokinase